MDDVAAVKQKTDIVAVVGEYVKLTKAGRNYKGLCPFHEERTPSFMVSPELQIYKCFGCGESGDVYSFLQKYEGLEFYEALKLLADRAGVKLSPRAGQDTSRKTEILEANKLAAQFYHFILTKHELGKIGLTYLTKERGLSRETIDKFSLGFAPRNPKLLFNFLTKKKRINAEVVESAGLSFPARGDYLDRFRQRVIFPISNHRSEVVALAGRILPEYDTGRTGKYINSPETPVYHKSDSLYGLDVTKDKIRETRTAVVVEGELDLLSVWQSGVENVVAIKGTAMTEGHVRILSRFADTLIMALDSDFAGDTAAIRGLSVAQNAGLEIKVVEMSYKDPDEFVRADAQGFKLALKKAVDAWEFVINVVAKRHDLATGSGSAKASRELVPILATIGDNIVRSHYLQKAAGKLGVPIEAVAKEVEKQEPRKGKKEIKMVNVEKKNRSELLEERLLAIYLQNPENVEFEEVERLIKTPVLAKIVRKLSDYLKTQKSLEISAFSGSLPEELSGHLANLILSPFALEDSTRELKMIKTELAELNLKEEITKLTVQISKLETKGKKTKGLQRKFQELSVELSKIQESQEVA